jgi:hypothetical protein
MCTVAETLLDVISANRAKFEESRRKAFRDA